MRNLGIRHLKLMVAKYYIECLNGVYYLPEILAGEILKWRLMFNELSLRYWYWVAWLLSIPQLWHNRIIRKLSVNSVEARIHVNTGFLKVLKITSVMPARQSLLGTDALSHGRISPAFIASALNEYYNG